MRPLSLVQHSEVTPQTPACLATFMSWDSHVHFSKTDILRSWW